MILTKVFDFNPLADFKLKELDPEKDSQCQIDDEQAISSLEPPLIITSCSYDTIPPISLASQDDQEGHLKLAKTGSVDLSSSFSSVASFRSDENADMASDHGPIPTENIKHIVVTEERKKVTFAYENHGVKRRTTSIHCTESAVKRTEHTLICSAGPSWFTWDEALGKDDKECEDDSARFDEEMNQSMGLDSEANKKDSDTGTMTNFTRLDNIKIIRTVEHVRG